MTAPLFRPANPADELAIARLWGYLMAELVRLDPRQPRPTPGAERLYAARVIATLEGTDSCTLIAELDGHIVGYGLGALIPQSDLFAPLVTGFVADLFVETGARRKGIGRGLGTALRGWFRDRGAVRILLNVDSANVAGRAFWAALGAREDQIKMQIDVQAEGSSP